MRRCSISRFIAITLFLSISAFSFSQVKGNIEIEGNGVVCVQDTFFTGTGLYEFEFPGSEEVDIVEFCIKPGRQYYLHKVRRYPKDDTFYEKIHTGFDLIYSPWETRFMRLVKEHGGNAYNGLKMLLYQGIIAYELWNDVHVSEEDAQAVYERLREHFM